MIRGVVSLFANWHPQDPQYIALHYISMGICVLLPWLFFRFETKFAKLIISATWLASCLIFSSTYLGFWTYHYNGVQLGFNPYGNPENWKMIVIGFVSVVPAFVNVIKLKNRPSLQASLVFFLGLLIVSGPALYNEISYEFYSTNGGEFDGGEGDFSGEEFNPTEPKNWRFAQQLGLISCNLIPAGVISGLWLYSRRVNHPENQQDTPSIIT